ncbi:MAG: T3SS (YopN, CesT) and YbjN peptide-binding chaperone 1 [Actinomycetota bacterium]
MTDPASLPPLVGGSQPTKRSPDPDSLGVTPQPPRTELRDYVLRILGSAGHLPVLDEDGDIAFRVHEQQLFIRCVESDVTMMRVFGLWQAAGLAENASADAVLWACNEVTRQLSVVKTTVADSVIVVSAEHIVTEGAAIDPLVFLSIEMVLRALPHVHEALEQASDR